MNNSLPARNAGQPGSQRFNLMRWFSLTALVSVATVSALAAWGLSSFLSGRMILREAEMTEGFLRNIIKTEQTVSFFTGASNPNSNVGDFLIHMSNLPDVIRINIYSLDRQVLWSTDAQLIGRRDPHPKKLGESVRATMVFSPGLVPDLLRSNAEEPANEQPVTKYVDCYIPIFDDEHRLLGAIEIYKVPQQLFDTIDTGVRLIWLIALAAGVFLYAALFWIVRRAHHIIEQQRDQLIESESLAVVGEMGTAVAHGLRNPLASIRSSAELALESPLPPLARECATDIAAQVDRLESWTRQLLTYARPANAHIEPVDINAVLNEALLGFRRDLERHGTAYRLELAGELPPIRGEPAILQQLVGSLIANSIEAMPRGGEIVLHSHFDTTAEQVVVEVRDNGPGLSPDAAKQAFRPFFTSKPKGLGLGLPLLRRVIERFGGSVALSSKPGAGTTVRMTLRTFT
jgi:two-component system sensor histidine kinase HydH